jgi:hypothetical protein
MKNMDQPVFNQQAATESRAQGAPAQPRAIPQMLCGKFVEEVIHSLVELDAEHLAALAAVAERFREDAALQLAPCEVIEMEAKMRLFAAVLAETRKNLRIFALGTSSARSYGYAPGGPVWAE